MDARNSRIYRAAKLMREILPGDPKLGDDPLSTAGDKPADLLARRVAETGPERPVIRELGLGALQVWQALSEAQGRGRGDAELAILFTDLVDFSDWVLEVGDEVALGLLRKVGAEQEAAICGRNGEVVKRLGDGVMAVFPDAGEAVAAAHEACYRVSALDVDGYRPRMRAGVHVGRPRRLGGDYLGVDVNIAARVAAAASADEVLISAPVCERLEDGAFELRRRKRFRAKGTPKELEVYSVERPMKSTST